MARNYRLGSLLLLIWLLPTAPSEAQTWESYLYSTEFRFYDHTSISSLDLGALIAANISSGITVPGVLAYRCVSAVGPLRCALTSYQNSVAG